MAQSEVQCDIFSPSDKFSETCRNVVKALTREPLIALDSEGVNLGRDGPLTLLQIGTLSGRVYLFDIMLTEDNQDKDFFRDTGLEKILTSKEIVKVIQSCSGDSAALFNQFGIRLENVFDTQVAHLVIEEHKGRLLPSRLKLAEICQKYSEHAKVYEGKEEVKEIWSKRVGNYWAKRPMTDEMIQYARGDVTAMIPEVYETQKRNLESNELLGKFHDRVEEEIDYYNDPAVKERRLQRNKERSERIIKSMATKYRGGADFEKLTDDEKKALESTQLKEILDFPTTIQDLKTASLRQYLAELDQNMTDPATFNPPRDIFYKLNEIEEIRDDVLKSEATRIKKQVKAMVLRDIEAKYDRTTRAQILTETEIRVLRSLKPLSNDEPSYSLLVLDLHWKTAEHDIDESMKMLENDMHEIPISISKLRLYISKERVPQSIKRKAQLLFDKYETVTLNRIQQSYSASTKISELSDQEKKFLAALKITSKPYGPVVNALHWNITYENLCKDIQEYRAGRLQPNDGLIGRIGFLAKNSTVPPDVQTKAKEFLKLLPRRQPRR